MLRLVYILLVGIVGAGIVHIAILFLVPHMSERDAWTRIAQLGDVHEPVRVRSDSSQNGALFELDPLFDGAACRFDLAQGPVRLHAPGNVPFWSLSIHDCTGLNIFSINDRTATERILDIVVATPLQMLELRSELPADFQSSIFVESEVESGIAVVRSFVQDASWQGRIGAYLDGLTCTPH
jgi:uncharacterized membrane protein